MGRRKYTYKIVKELLNEKGYELISEEYISIDKKLSIKDNEGYYYYVIFNNLLKYKMPLKFHKSNPYTIQNIKLWCKLNNKPFELVSEEYINAHIKLKWKCLIEECGEEFESNWNNISSDGGCSYCAGQKVGLSNCLTTKNINLANEWHSILNGDLTPYDVTANSGRYIWWQCSKNPKHVWHTTIYNRYYNNSGCPYCAGKLPTEENNLLINNPELCKEWNYDKNDKRPEEYTPMCRENVWWKCSDSNCKHEWKSIICNRNGKLKSGCPKCNESKGEKKIDETLINKYWIIIKQKEFEQLIDKDKYNKNYFIQQKEFEGLFGLGYGLLSYDFYLPILNLLIEYQGEQHERYIKGFHKSYEDFEKQVEHDRRKREYAKNNNIKLLEIWYYDFDNIEEILERELNNLLLKEVI